MSRFNSIALAVKHRLVKIVNAYPVKEFFLSFQNFGLKVKPCKTGALLMSVIDKKRSTQGLTDRFKGIVSVYAFSKLNHVPFRVLFNFPFELTRFLTPNTYNWIPSDDELNQSVFSTRFVIMRKRPSFERMFRLMPLNKQYRVYSNLDYLSQINQKFDSELVWGELFHELFKPTPLLAEQLAYHCEQIGTSGFIACVFRFQSLLGDFKEYKYKAVSENKQQELLELNRAKLVEIINETKSVVLVTSDSQRFISFVSDIPGVYIIPGEVVHLDCVTNETTDVYLKSFVDFFMISKARVVYSIGTKEMYATNFPEYAAKLNNVPFKRILIG